MTGGQISQGKSTLENVAALLAIVSCEDLQLR